MLIKTNEGHIKAVSVDDLIEVELAEGESFMIDYDAFLNVLF
ncbi:hypothetical protein S100333_04427 (plasmid) [Bacillus subtilis subsp. subtilis]|nr:hypothetical protein S100333_04427 [Bacillus subtilis subsp. subtilis]